MWVFEPLINTILYSIFFAAWYLIIWFPFNILKLIFKLFNFLGISKLKDILFGQGLSFNLPFFFKVFVVIAIFLLLLFFIFTLVRYLIQPKEEIEGENRLNLAIKKLIPAFALIFVVPTITFASFLFLQILLDLIFSVFNENKSLDGAVFSILKPDSIAASVWNELSQNYKPLTYTQYTNLSSGEGIQIFIFGILIIVLIILVIFNCVLNMVGKIVKIFFLFIHLPPVSISMVIDGGQRFKEWKTQFIQNVSTIFLYQIVFSLFFIWINLSNEIANEISQNTFTFSKIIVKILMWAGGAFIIDDIVHSISEIVGFKIQNFKSMNSTAKQLASASKVTATAGIAAGGFAASKVLGIDKTKEKLKNELNSGKITKSEYQDSLKQYKKEKKEAGLGWKDTRVNGLLPAATTASQNIKHKALDLKKSWIERKAIKQIKKNKDLTTEQQSKIKNNVIKQKFEISNKQNKIRQKQAKIKDFNLKQEKKMENNEITEQKNKK